MSNENQRLTISTAIFALLYFIILFAERTQSLVRVLTHGAFFASFFDGYVNTLTALSLTAAAVLLANYNNGFWRALAGRGEPDHTHLTVTAGVLLLSGMVHTEFTLAPIQFAAYGMLIAAMILHTIEVAPGKDKVRLWYSLAYLTSFSMAIPVMYRSFLPRSGLFHVIEALTAILLVIFFTVLLRRVFLGRGEDLLAPLPLSVAVVADAAILALRWQEKVNTFVLVFAALTLLLFIIGKILFHFRKKESNSSDLSR